MKTPGGQDWEGEEAPVPRPRHAHTSEVNKEYKLINLRSSGQGDENGQGGDPGQSGQGDQRTSIYITNKKTTEDANKKSENIQGLLRLTRRSRLWSTRLWGSGKNEVGQDQNHLDRQP